MDYTLANVALIVFDVIVLGVMLIYQLASQYRSTRLNRLLTIVIFGHLLVLLNDEIAWLIPDSSPQKFIGLVASDLATCLIAVIMIVLLIRYLLYYLKLKTETSRATQRGILIVLSLLILLIFLPHFQELFSLLFEGDIYHIDSSAWAVTSLEICIAIALVAVLVFYRKSFTPKTLFVFLGYGVLVFIVMLFPSLTYDLMFIYAAFVFALLVLFVNIRMQDEKRLREKELEVIEGKIAVMVSQIQPHFLYNSLSVVADLTAHNPKKARQALAEFSDYLHVNLDSLSRKDPISFEEELKHAKLYLSMAKRRFGDRVNVEYDIEAENFFLPVLTLQPIIENAVIHGITMREEGGTIRIRTRETDKNWEVTIEDDGVGFDEEAPPDDEDKTHVGIANARHRLEIQSKASFEIKSTPGKGTKAQIILPKTP